MYTTEPFSFSRQVASDGLAESIKKHWIHALIEVDVTKPRNRLREIKQETGQSLSFTGFLIYCCAKAVDEDKHMIENRGHLCLTFSFDHDIIDGAPAARFVQAFKEFVECGNGLYEE